MTLEALLAHPDVARLARALRSTPGKVAEAEPDSIWAAIAVTLRLGEGGEPELLLIKRAEQEGDPWSGHVACPGGRSEDGDADLEATAIRETREETGIDIGQVGRILGTLDDLNPRTPYLPWIVIRPFVAVAPSSVAVTPSDEVAAWFWVPLSEVRAPSAWGSGTVLVRNTPRTERTFTYREHHVWGLTERVLRQLVTLLG